MTKWTATIQVEVEAATRPRAWEKAQEIAEAQGGTVQRVALIPSEEVD